MKFPDLAVQFTDLPLQRLCDDELQTEACGQKPCQSENPRCSFHVESFPSRKLNDFRTEFRVCAGIPLKNPMRCATTPSAVRGIGACSLVGTAETAVAHRSQRGAPAD